MDETTPTPTPTPDPTTLTPVTSSDWPTVTDTMHQFQSFMLYTAVAEFIVILSLGVVVTMLLARRRG